MSKRSSDWSTEKGWKNEYSGLDFPINHKERNSHQFDKKAGDLYSDQYSEDFILKGLNCRGDQSDSREGQSHPRPLLHMPLHPCTGDK